MPDDLPDYYFRLRENGALVFRLLSDSHQARLEMQPIATVQLRNGEIRPQGERALSPADMAAIREWLAARQALQARRETDDILRCIDQLNLTAQWLQARASADQVAAVCDPLLLAMHDLRAVLLRKRAEALVRDTDGADKTGAEGQGA